MKVGIRAQGWCGGVMRMRARHDAQSKDKYQPALRCSGVNVSAGWYAGWYKV
jgi:hypothetical protein